MLKGKIVSLSKRPMGQIITAITVGSLVFFFEILDIGRELCDLIFGWGSILCEFVSGFFNSEAEAGSMLSKPSPGMSDSTLAFSAGIISFGSVAALIGWHYLSHVLGGQAEILDLLKSNQQDVNVLIGRMTDLKDTLNVMYDGLEGSHGATMKLLLEICKSSDSIANDIAADVNSINRAMESIQTALDVRIVELSQHNAQLLTSLREHVLCDLKEILDRGHLNAQPSEALADAIAELDNAVPPRNGVNNLGSGPQIDKATDSVSALAVPTRQYQGLRETDLQPVKDLSKDLSLPERSQPTPALVPAQGPVVGVDSYAFKSLPALNVIDPAVVPVRPPSQGWFSDLLQLLPDWLYRAESVPTPRGHNRMIDYRILSMTMSEVKRTTVIVSGGVALLSQVARGDVGAMALTVSNMLSDPHRVTAESMATMSYIIRKGLKALIKGPALDPSAPGPSGGRAQPLVDDQTIAGHIVSGIEHRVRAAAVSFENSGADLAQQSLEEMSARGPEIPSPLENAITGGSFLELGCVIVGVVTCK